MIFGEASVGTSGVLERECGSTVGAPAVRAAVAAPGFRVAVASSGLGHVARGIEAWAADLARALWKRGVDVTLCKGGGTAEAPYERVIPCWQRGSGRARCAAQLVPRGFAWRLGLGSAYEIEQTTFAWRLLAFLRAAKIDLLHVQDPLVALTVQRAHRLSLVPTRSILAHGTEEPDAFLSRLTYVQHLAPEHAERCRAAGVWGPTWTTIPNFVETERFAPGPAGSLREELGIPSEALVVLTAAAVKKSHKRIDYLIEEFSRLRAEHPTLPVWLVVAGGKEADTDELVVTGRRILGDRVRFLVRFPRDKMADLYRCADVFTLTSLTEMMPIALLEATASGLPCIVNRHAVLRRMAGPGGEAIDMSKPGALAAALAGLLGNADTCRKLGRLGRDHCVTHFGEEAVLGGILAYYRKVLAADRRSGEDRARPVVTRAHRVSVVIPGFNCGRWIGQAIESVLAQTVPPAEIVVIDDGSTDDTARRLEPYKDRVRCIQQENQGVAAARNRGIALSSGDLIAFLDADDVWHPRKLEFQLVALDENPGLGLLGAATYDWPATSAPMLDGIVRKPVVVRWRDLVVRNALTTSSVIVRRDLLEQAGFFDPALHGPEDYDLWLRIAEKAAVANLSAPLVGYRAVPGSLGQQPATMERGLRRVLERLDSRRAWGARWMLRRKAHSYCGYSCAYLYGAAGNQPMALRRLLGSLVGYPLPYRRAEVRMPLARARLLAAILTRWLRGDRDGRIKPAGAGQP